MLPSWRIFGLLATLVACDTGDKGDTGPVDTGDESLDKDGDGYLKDEDCNDQDATVNPGVFESCNGVDDDCDGEVDDGIATTWYADTDADGFGDPENTVDTCYRPEGYVPVGSDCDDTEATIYPGNSELCDGLDNDCDGDIDEGATNGEDTDVWYKDADGDGFGDIDTPLEACGSPDGYVLDDTDCDDDDEDTWPGADEVCDGEDDDCDGVIDDDPVDPTTWYDDVDSDGYGDPASETTDCDPPSGSVDVGGDCDDATASTNPGADEVCDDVDNDCDGDIDEDATDASVWYTDGDGDGYGDTDSATTSCEAPSDGVGEDGDCDDAEPAAHPGGTEVCDDIDNDCDGSTDEGSTDASTWYADDDGDGYGDPGSSTLSCSAPTGYVSDKTDCDDSASSVHPGASETCNDTDDDCDGSIDESATDRSTWYADDDGDAYGDASASTTACDAPAGYVSDKTDCDDTIDDVHPGATEYCNDRDDDCDGSIDESAADATTWYADDDGDAYGDSSTSTTSCDAPSGYVASRTDCDDSDSGVHPGATETCDDEDDDCDGSIDEGASDATTWYADDDSDTYGDSSTSTTSCDAPTGYVSDKTDCDDTDAGVHPGASEYCDDEDDDCDGTVDDSAVDRTTWYKDADSDTYGASATTKKACDKPSGYVADKTDCDDTTSSIHPGATEYCNSKDDDCDGTTDEDAADVSTWYKDADSDTYGSTTSTTACTKPTGYVTTKTDCDDTNSSIYPGATETCNSKDDDCDGSIDEGASDATTWYADDDSDDYGDPSTSTTSCDAPSGYVTDKTDCDDADASIYPGATEYCNDEDDDCDGTVDDSPVDRTTWYKDADSDTYGTSSTTKKACDKPSGYVSDKTDCDDTTSSIHPGATEYCNSKDDDCDGTTDEDAADVSTWYKDADSDTYGSTTSTTACTKPTGYVTSKTDCDDTNSSIYPGATEYCNSKDDDCDGTTDEDAVDVSTWYKDADSDTYGSTTSTTACTKPTGYVTTKTDCDDTNSSIYPGATEYCNSKDDDCDGTTDEDAVDTSTWYKDADSDTYGSTTSTTACTKPSGYVTTKTDCDDTSASIYPGATEYCNSKDDDCDGSTDESAVDASTWYKDADSDSFGSDTTSTSCTMPTGYVSDTTDCDDTLSSVYPGAAETCEDGIDQDCDGDDAPCGPSGDLDLSLADARIIGETAYDYSSSSLSSAGDVDGDGYDDVLIGAYGTDAKGSYTGSAYIVLGPVSGSLDLSLADANVYGETSGDYAGSGVCSAGDADGDGYDDVVIGARNEDTVGSSSGAIYLVTGPISGSFSLSRADAKRMAIASYDNAGVYMAGGVDMDADGYDDSFIAAFQDDTGGTSAGAVFLLNGPYTGTASLSTADGRLVGENSNDYAGDGVDIAGDVDADGVPDLVVGAYGQDAGASTAGAAYLVLGPFSGTVDLSAADAKRTGEISGDYAGTGVGGAGDVDGDGYDDVIVGAYNFDVGTAGNAGDTYLLYGPFTGTASLSTADAEFQGLASDDRSGYAVSGAGDVDGDDLDDFLVGAYHEDTGGTDAGAAYLFLGGAWTGTYSVTSATALLYGETGGDNVGWDVSPEGDANADGFSDFLIGAWKQDTGGTDAGMGYLMYGGAI